MKKALGIVGRQSVSRSEVQKPLKLTQGVSLIESNVRGRHKLVKMNANRRFESVVTKDGESLRRCLSSRPNATSPILKDISLSKKNTRSIGGIEGELGLQSLEMDRYPREVWVRHNVDLILSKAFQSISDGSDPINVAKNLDKKILSLLGRGEELRSAWKASTRSIAAKHRKDFSAAASTGDTQKCLQILVDFRRDISTDPTVVVPENKASSDHCLNLVSKQIYRVSKFSESIGVPRSNKRENVLKGHESDVPKGRRSRSSPNLARLAQQVHGSIPWGALSLESIVKVEDQLNLLDQAVAKKANGKYINSLIEISDIIEDSQNGPTALQ